MQYTKKSKLRKKIIVMIGAFPPPVHGLAVVNETMRSWLNSDDVEVYTIDLSAGSLGRDGLIKFRRAYVNIKGFVLLLKFLIGGRSCSAYISVSGGLGKFYESVFVFICRLFKLRIILHHHSFAYLNRYDWLAEILFFIAGRRCLHIVLCPSMEVHLRQQYKSVNNVSVLSNVVTLPLELSAGNTEHKKMKSIGYLGNISEEKGIFEFLNVAKKIDSIGLNIKFLIAGPFQDSVTENKVLKILHDCVNIEYLGPVYGSEKVEFFLNIDALLFPTKYINEAEPLTILESFQAGVPVIAWGRGCIDELIPANGGISVPVDVDYSVSATTLIQNWYNNSDEYLKSSKCVLDAHYNLLLKYKRTQAEIIDYISGKSRSCSPSNKNQLNN